MPQTKAQKQQTLEKLQKNLENKKGFFFVDFQGINVKDLSALRSQLKNAGAKLQVAKKTLLQKALKEKNLPLDAKALQGEVAAVFAKEDFLQSKNFLPDLWEALPHPFQVLPMFYKETLKV